ncbi:hypothetical protein BDN70DRAFT_11521 [Pholiota conissans]|uniref:Uncharacterized protein n=1 Tax=Pholiota conissans TaxID=109636 RepID=A0A9P5ZE65_9AGAR|nr:hypothetical protein BDN70DRAFT_11521 [Pholiota conissans]
MQAEDAQDVVDVAYRLNEPVDNGWCAGNEAPLLIDIWRSMISGPPIDDQRDLRMGGRTAPNSAPAGPTPGPSTAPSSSGTPHQQSGADGSESEDSEEDPNAYHDRILNRRQAQRASEAPQKIAGYVDLDESDYGSDSDESD